MSFSKRLNANEDYLVSLVKELKKTYKYLYITILKKRLVNMYYLFIFR